MRFPLIVALVLLLLAAPLAQAALGLSPAALPSPLAPTAAAPARASAAPLADDDAYLLEFDCPRGSAAPPPGAIAGCPEYVLDAEDIMSSPILVVDPTNPSVAAFSALHGGKGVHPAPADQPPSTHSRENAIHQPHTTFRTTDAGGSWRDNPYQGPAPLDDTTRTEAYGEDNAAALDAQGRLYLANIYAYRADAPTTTAGVGTGAPFRYGVGTWKADTIERGDVQYHSNVKLLPPQGEATDKMDTLGLVYVPATDVVVATWRESSSADANASFLAAAWTNASEGAVWHAIDVNASPHGCAAVTNPIVQQRAVVLGCQPIAGARVSLSALDTTSWAWTKLADGPLGAPHMTLIERDEQRGLMILVTSGLGDQNAPFVKVAYGSAGGSRWGSGDDITQHALPGAAPGDLPFDDVRVTAATYVPRTGGLHLIVTTHANDQLGATAGSAAKPAYAKSFVAYQAEGGFQARVDLGLGKVSRADVSPSYAGEGDGAYDDLHDSITIFHAADGNDREFVAFGDYGFVRFGELVEKDAPIPLVPLSTPVPPVPLASPGTATVAVGIGSGIAAAGMVVRTVMAKRRVAAEAGAE